MTVGEELQEITKDQSQIKHLSLIILARSRIVWGEIQSTTEEEMKEILTQGHNLRNGNLGGQAT